VPLRDPGNASGQMWMCSQGQPASRPLQLFSPVDSPARHHPSQAVESLHALGVIFSRTHQTICTGNEQNNGWAIVSGSPTCVIVTRSDGSTCEAGGGGGW
jgi:hypothetical protein